jgi:lipopolysaccharide/colanic/teichoic acid biosynthesis glycosyltransferase
MTKIFSDKHFHHYVTNEYPWLEKFKPENRIITGRFYYYLKRTFDVLIVLFSLIFIIPVGIICGILIKLESPKDPVLFKQERTGRGGNRFVMYKFRTMVTNTDVYTPDMTDNYGDDELYGVLKPENDPRITPVGRILRKLSLDELPQLFNVLKGDMSLVGPRPTSWGLQGYELWQTERLDVLPGLTCLWQLYARGEMNFNQRLRWDILYISNRSLMLDLEILIRTIMAVLQQRGAR